MKKIYKKAHCRKKSVLSLGRAARGVAGRGGEGSVESAPVIPGNIITEHVLHALSNGQHIPNFSTASIIRLRSISTEH